MAGDEELDPSGGALGVKERRAFLQLPLAERRRLLAERADQMFLLYDQESATRERIEWQGGDVLEY